jgi:beta-lactamase regulating signal transducer with metallopeptidase domain
MLPPYFRQEVIHAICWTLIHSLWLGILAAMLAGFVIICTRKLPVAIRYRLLTTDLVLFVLAVGITFCYQVKQGHGVSAVAGSQTLVPAAMDQTNVAQEGAANLIGDYGFLVDYRPAVNYLNRHAFIIVDIWLICLFIQLSRLMAGLYGIGRLRRNGTKPPGKWNDTLLLLSGQLGLKRRVSLLESASVKIPAAFGFFKPVILVPLGILSNLPAEQVETILLHELAHIKRGDYITNLLLHITEAVFFFNPGLRWLNALIRREREACCDDIVLSVTVDRTIYLNALVSFREYFTGKTSSPYAVALGKGRNSLLWRVRRMLTHENKTLDIMEKTILSFGLAAVIAVGLISMKPVATSTPRPQPRIIKDTLPVRDTLRGRLREDSIRKRKAELDAQQASSYTHDAMNRHMEEQTLRNKAMLDSLYALHKDTLQRNADAAKLNEEQAKLVEEQEKLNEEQAKFAEEHAKITYDRLQLSLDETSGSSDRRIQRITNSLKEAGLISDDKNFSFSLDSERLLVNDKTAPAPLFQKLKERYLHSSKDHFNYMQRDGITQTEISVHND